jgi:hypothetical protein
MCFSFQSSITAWIISIILGIYLWHRNHRYDRWNASFIFTFTLIQLLEAGLWKNINTNTSVLTKFILLCLLLQPFVQTLCAQRTNPNSKLLFSMCIVYGMILLYTLTRILSNDASFNTKVGDKGHLVWNDNKYPNSFVGGKFGLLICVLYLLGLFVPLLYQHSKGIPLIFIGILTALYSWYMTRGKEFSSYWCYTSVVYGVGCILIN